MFFPGPHESKNGLSFIIFTIRGKTRHFHLSKTSLLGLKIFLLSLVFFSLGMGIFFQNILKKKHLVEQKLFSLKEEVFQYQNSQQNVFDHVYGKTVTAPPPKATEQRRLAPWTSPVTMEVKRIFQENQHWSVDFELHSKGGKQNGFVWGAALFRSEEGNTYAVGLPQGLILGEDFRPRDPAQGHRFSVRRFSPISFRVHGENHVLERVILGVHSLSKEIQGEKDISLPLSP